MNLRPVSFTLALALGSLPACSSDPTTTTTTGDATSSSTGGAGGAASTGSTGSGGAGGGSTASATTSSSTGSATSSSTGGVMAFTLTSPGFSEGSPIPVESTCAGKNSSPALMWTPGPSSTLSYAVVLTDKTNSLLHWVIWDIPAVTTALPAEVENAGNPATPAGAKQAKSYDNKTFGYLGPCPPKMHTYEFAVFALDVATLPGLTTASTRAEVDAVILAHDLGSATLTGTYTP